jgi:hypothetical protein
MIRMLLFVMRLRSAPSDGFAGKAYRWFCKLGIEDKIPITLYSRSARDERFRESDALCRVFESVGRCALRPDSRPP